MVLFLKEFVSFAYFFWRLPVREKQVVFYVEKASDYRYLEGILQPLLSHASIGLCYITSDLSDPLLHSAPDRLKVFYFKRLFPFVSIFMDAKLFVLTMPDLGKFQAKRSVRGAHHLYLFHALVSTHMIYRFGAFDHYDTILCAGPHHLREIRKTESLYKLPAKQLLEVGYPHLDRLIQAHQRYRAAGGGTAGGKGKVLIAPSWGPANILESCLEPLVGALSQAGYPVVIRPHPEWVKRHPQLTQQISAQLVRDGKVELDLKFSSDQFLHEAELLVTDWSGIALEYAFGTERPVLFVDVPRKVTNPRYSELELTPLEVSVRNRIGKLISLEEVSKAAEHARELMEHRAQYRRQVLQAREQAVFHLGQSSAVAVGFILDHCRQA